MKARFKGNGIGRRSRSPGAIVGVLACGLLFSSDLSAAVVIDGSYAGSFAIATARYPQIEERFVTQWVDEFSVHNHYLAQVSVGTGTARAEAGLDYDFTSGALVASGLVDVQSNVGDAHSTQVQAESFTQVWFTLTESMFFNFASGTTLDLDPADFDGFPTILNRIQQFNLGGGASGFTGSSGVLTPGQYLITAQVKLVYGINPAVYDESYVDSRATFDFNLTFAPIPAPGTMAAGAIGIGAFSRLRRRF